MVKLQTQRLNKMVIIPCTYYKQTTLHSWFVPTSSNEPVKIAKSLIPCCVLCILVLIVCVPNSGMSHPTSFIVMCAYIRHADCTLARGH